MTGPARLAVEASGSGPTIAFLHGFTQTGRSWASFAETFGGTHRTVLVDLPGHGSSSEVIASLDAAADLVADAVGRATYVGYSLGGRHALHVALRHPELVERLVLIGATAGLDTADERAARRHQDELLACELERDGVTAFLDRWLSLPLFAGLPIDRAGRQDRERNTVSGLASSLRNAGTGTQEPSWERLASLPMPVLVLAGEHDAKFAALGRRMAERIGERACFCSVKGAGHSAHLERPDEVRRLIAEFLATT